MRRGIGVLVALLATLPGAGAQTLYRWVDENGVTHYSKTAPEKRKSQPVCVTPPRPAVETGGTAKAKTADGSTPADVDRRVQQRLQAEEQARAAQAAQAAQRSVQCAQTRNELARLIATKPAIRGRPDTAPGVEVMNNAERSLRIEQAEKDIARLCD